MHPDALDCTDPDQAVPLATEQAGERADAEGYQDISLLDTPASYLDVKPRPDGPVQSATIAAEPPKDYIEVEDDVDAIQGYVDVDMDATQGYVDVNTDARDKGYVDVAVEARPGDAASSDDGLTSEQGDGIDAVVNKPVIDAQQRSEAAELAAAAEEDAGSEDEAGTDCSDCILIACSVSMYGSSQSVVSLLEQGYMTAEHFQDVAFESEH
jgi:hypothetical protein